MNAFQKWSRIIAALVGCSLVASACRSPLRAIGHWTVQPLTRNDSAIAWADFQWVGDSIGNRYFDRLAMNIPATIPGLPYNFTFQFDLGADVTMLYGNNVFKIFEGHPELQPVKIGDAEIVKNFTIEYGSLFAKTEACYVKSAYGDSLALPGATDTPHIGTIGADMFQDKVLVIDYPRQRFAVCQDIPAVYSKNLVDMDLDDRGRVILPMVMKGKKYRISFDNGSSLFSLITVEKNISKFSSGPDTDSLEISSWRKKHYVTGKMITDTFELAGRKFANVKVYANHTGLGIDDQTDGMTGNALFWNNTIVIDFRHKKFGIVD